ncbi:TetR/AcrR family transcriptional regulator [Patulibacter defluvii]|uniref:TetR/AcrR family transcriptional regulator n=1 Tax=Patulibacter defluvii TaxID=3095358 RepID=UPI002A754BE5|nr:TetR/AcrR family transcriptional regulator [Patulibacter sp. DM4]
MARPPARPKLRERYDERQQQVIDACAQAFAQRGYHGTSIDDLIAATGLARGGLYHYIGSKQGALTRILEDLMTPLLEDASAVVAQPDATAEQRLRALVRVWMRHVEQYQAHVRVFQQERHTIEADPGWDDVRRDRDAFSALLTGVLRDGAEGGDFALDDPPLAALALQGMVNHAATWFDPAGRLTADQVADGFCDAIVRGIGAADPRRR